MKVSAKPAVVTAIWLCASIFSVAQIPSFRHIILVVQENRSPDNLFQGLCSPPYGTSASCNTSPTGSQYNIQTSNWLDKTSSTGIIQPIAVPLANGFDLGHKHVAFTAMCDLNSAGACLMDGAGLSTCSGTCPPSPWFQYVDYTSGVVDPYLDLATQYGWANYMFQTNQGPSYPAHQFLFGGTSAPNTQDDALAIFAAENVSPEVVGTEAGCVAPAGVFVWLMSQQGEIRHIFPCFEHQTLADLLVANGISWKYYSSGVGSIWTAPNSIQHICKAVSGKCTGPSWINNVVLTPSQVLTDISKCKLSGVSWVIPTGQNSDHPKSNNGGGPSWVASIVNAIGNNAKCADGETYWDNTAIVVTWDDWGGWYDHQPPVFLAPPQGDYQYGFRVPMIVVSAYTPSAYVNNDIQDFGSILRFVEKNFGLEEGALNFADARATTDLSGFFDLTQPPRAFTTIPAPRDASYFLNDKEAALDPDDD